MSHERCQDPWDAGQALIERSGLAHFNGQQFDSCGSEPGFEKYWEKRFDRDFGRYLAWVLFLVGAENLAKAACECNGVEVRSTATLGDYIRHKGFFQALCKEIRHCGGAGCVLIEKYQCINDVRNRDTHSFRRGVRSPDFPLVEQTFVPAFNILVDAMRHSGHELRKSRRRKSKYLEL